MLTLVTMQGLMFLGHESAATKSLNVFAMPRMEKFLRNNGPWSQLVDYKNIEISPLPTKYWLNFQEA